LTPVIRGTTEAAAAAASNFKNVRRRDVMGPFYKFGASATVETAASTGTIDSELAPAEGMVLLLALEQRPVSAAVLAQKYINVLFVSAGRLLASAHSANIVERGTCY
jgi:hypothetical protein